VSPALGVNSSQFVSSSKLSSVLACQSLRRTPSAHSTRGLAFLTAERAIYVRDGFCVPLVTILSEGSSPRVCPSSEVRPKSVSDTLSHVYIHTMLFPLYSPRLNPHRTFTVVTSFNYHHVLSLLPRLTSYSSSWGHTLQLSPLFGPLRFSRYLLHRPSITPTSNTFVPPTQCSTSYLPSFAGEMQQATTRPRRLAADLVALCLLAYRRT